MDASPESNAQLSVKRQGFLDDRASQIDRLGKRLRCDGWFGQKYFPDVCQFLHQEKCIAGSLAYKYWVTCIDGDSHLCDETVRSLEKRVGPYLDYLRNESPCREQSTKVNWD